MNALRWAIADTWTVTVRDLLHWRHEPSRIAWSLAFPVLSILLFGYVFGSAITVPGGGDYMDYLLPGLFVMTIAFGTIETLFGMAMDAEKGITTRFRSMPMSPIAIVGGRSVADMFNSLLGVLVMVLAGLVVGWSWNDGIVNALLALMLLLWLRFAMLWLGILLGLFIPSAETAGQLSGLMFPITMISNTFVAPEQMPDWLGTIAEWNPLSSTVTAIRELFGNPAAVSDSWIAQHATLMAIVWPLVLIAIFAPLAVRRYHSMSQ